MNRPLRSETVLRALDRLTKGLGLDEYRAEVRRQLREHESRGEPTAFRPLPYSNPLGPTGEPKTFGIVGGGNRSGTAAPGSLTWAEMKAHRRLPAAFWDPGCVDQDRQLDNKRRQFSRIKANGGRRKPAHRPRTITAEQEQRVRDLLAAGCGIKKAARIVGIGVSAVQRIKQGVP